MDGVEHLVAPLVRSFPVRVRIPSSSFVRTKCSDLVRHLHTQLTESLEHEHCDLSNIQKVVVGSAGGKNLFDVLFDFEPEEQLLLLGKEGQGGSMIQTDTIDAIGVRLSMRVSYGDDVVILLTSEGETSSDDTLGAFSLPLISQRYAEVLRLILASSTAESTVGDVTDSLTAKNLIFSPSRGTMSADTLVKVATEEEERETTMTSRPMLPLPLSDATDASTSEVECRRRINSTESALLGTRFFFHPKFFYYIPTVILFPMTLTLRYQQLTHLIYPFLSLVFLPFLIIFIDYHQVVWKQRSHLLDQS